MSARVTPRQGPARASAPVGGSANDAWAPAQDRTLRMLDAALATELISMLRCRRNHFAVDSVRTSSLGAAFLAHSAVAQSNADAVAGRIVGLGGTPDFGPEGLAGRSHAQYVEATGVAAMLRDSVGAERVAARCYRTLIDLLGDEDSRTTRLLRSMVSSGTSFADELEASWLALQPL